jgi:uncharacterized protein (TIGR00730 family)
MQRVCVYCGSSPGNRREYTTAARGVGRLLLERRLGLVYGGASVGLMGVIADTMLAGGGEVIGVIPAALRKREVAHDGLSMLHLVETMHQRKAMMEKLSDAFIALPGGFGTLDELFEILTWAQLGMHQKPIGLLNIEGYFDGLIGYLEHCTGQGFVRAEQLSAVLVDNDPARLLDRFENYQPMPGKRWLERSQA